MRIRTCDWQTDRRTCRFGGCAFRSLPRAVCGAGCTRQAHTLRSLASSPSRLSPPRIATWHTLSRRLPSPLSLRPLPSSSHITDRTPPTPTIPLHPPDPRPEVDIIVPDLRSFLTQYLVLAATHSTSLGPHVFFESGVPCSTAPRTPLVPYRHSRAAPTRRSSFSTQSRECRITAYHFELSFLDRLQECHKLASARCHCCYPPLGLLWLEVGCSPYQIPISTRPPYPTSHSAIWSSAPLLTPSR